MKIKILEKARVVMSNYGSIHDYFAWPTVKRLKNGRLALGASGYRMEHICPFGKAVLSFSEDEGKTWSEFKLFYDNKSDVIWHKPGGYLRGSSYREYEGYSRDRV